MRGFLQNIAVLGVFVYAGAGFGEQIDNPTYQSWARCKVGTRVTLKQSATISMMPEMGTDTVITQKLVDVKPEAATLEVTMKTTMLGQTTETKTSSMVPAKIEKGREHIPQSVKEMKVEMKDLKEGHETIEVMGVKVDATTQEFTLTMEPMAAATGPASAPAARSAAGVAGPMTAKVKTWTSGEIPGGTAKVEQYMDMGAMGDIKTVMTLVEYTVAK